MHKIQQKILKSAESGRFQNKTLREMAKILGEDRESPQKIKHHIDQLQKKGLIVYDPTSKSIDLVKKKPNPVGFVRIPILGSASCGPATQIAEQNFEGYLTISRSLIGQSGDFFAIRAHGNSLNRADISGQNVEDGDYVIIDFKARAPRNGDFVLSCIEGYANIKKFVFDKKNNVIALLSQSEENIAPILINPDDNYFINGKAVKVIKVPRG